MKQSKKQETSLEEPSLFKNTFPNLKSQQPLDLFFTTFPMETSAMMKEESIIDARTENNHNFDVTKKDITDF